MNLHIPFSNQVYTPVKKEIKWISFTQRIYLYSVHINISEKSGHNGHYLQEFVKFLYMTRWTDIERPLCVWERHGRYGIKWIPATRRQRYSLITISAVISPAINKTHQCVFLVNTTSRVFWATFMYREKKMSHQLKVACTLPARYIAQMVLIYRNSLNSL